MARYQLYVMSETTRILLLLTAAHMGNIWCVGGAVTTDAGTTPNLLFTTIEASGKTGDVPPSDGTTPNLNDSFEMFATGVTHMSPRMAGKTEGASTPTEAPSEPRGRYGAIHWLLFTGWHMPLAMAGVEIIAYCVTIFIVFGFGQRRSRVKRFGHFSWKRPNPLQAHDGADLGVTSARNAREHHVGAPAKGSGHKVRKPSVRGHRP